MSYDVRFGVETKMPNRWGERFAIVEVPSMDSPTYNYSKLFRACMDWDYEQDVWYPMSEVIPRIERGIHELSFNREQYIDLEPENGWGTLEGALNCLRDWYDNLTDRWGITHTWPIESLWFRW